MKNENLIPLATWRGLAIDSNAWVVGGFVKTIDWVFRICNGFYDMQCELSSVLVYPDSLGIYTGLSDVNGNPIFASVRIDGKTTKGGDRVLQQENGEYNVIYLESSFGVVRPGDNDMDSAISFIWDDPEIYYSVLGIQYDLEVENA